MSSNISGKPAMRCTPRLAEEREGWVLDRAQAVLEGRAQDVAVGLRRAATRKQLSQSQREPVDKAADYIDNNQLRLRYDLALAQGLPIATGVIEGRLSSFGQRSDGYHRRALGPGPGRSHPQAALTEDQWRPGSLPGVSLRAGTQAQLSGSSDPCGIGRSGLRVGVVHEQPTTVDSCSNPWILGGRASFKRAAPKCADGKAQVRPDT